MSVQGKRFVKALGAQMSRGLQRSGTLLAAGVATGLYRQTLQAGLSPASVTAFFRGALNNSR
jgi:hypothetical protein